MGIENDSGNENEDEEDSGWIVSGVMTSFAYMMEVRDPLSLIWVIFTARFVYGMDRYWDGKTINNDSIESILFALCVSVFVLYTKDMMLWSIPEVLSLCMYPHFKESSASLYKCVYVGLCWTLSTCVIPQMMQASDVSVWGCVGLFMLFTGVSNLADIPDIDEDKKNDINTVPVMYGRRKATALSFTLITSSGLSLFYRSHTKKDKHTSRRYQHKAKPRSFLRKYNMIRNTNSDYVCVLQRSLQLSRC
jgi:hypothetical protein